MSVHRRPCTRFRAHQRISIRSGPLACVASSAALVALAVLVGLPAVGASGSAAAPPRVRTPEQDARLLRRTYFSRGRDAEVRAAGYAAIRRVAGLEDLLATATVLADEADDVRAVLLERLEDAQRPGLIVLAWLAISDDDPSLRGAAAMRLPTSPDPTVAWAIREALRHGTPMEIDRAAELAAWLGATDLMPALVDHLAIVRVRRLSPNGGIGLAQVLGTRSADLGPGTLPTPILARTGTILSAGPGRRPLRRWLEPRPAVHRSLLVLARLAHGPEAPDHGYDAAAWRRWIAEVTPMGPPRP